MNAYLRLVLMSLTVGDLLLVAGDEENVDIVKIIK